MLRRENAWIWLVGIIMCVGLTSVACTGDDPADLEGDDFAGADGDFDDGDTAADPGGGGAIGGSGGGAEPGESGKLSTDTDPTFCTKVEGSQIGEPGVTVQAGVVTVTVTDWQEKSDEPGEYVGFKYKTSGGMVWFGAKAGVEIFYHWGAKSWVNPHIEKGGDVKGLSWIIFCEDDGSWIEDCPYADGDDPDAFDDDDEGGSASGDSPDASDGLPDGSSGTGDADGDGVPDAEDGVDGDGPDGSGSEGSEGLPDGSSGVGDADGDGIPDAEDTVDGPNPEGTDDGCDTCEMDDVGTDEDTDTVVVV